MAKLRHKLAHREAHAFIEILSQSEVWAPIKDYEGIFEISSLGRVKKLAYTAILFGKDKKYIPEKLLTVYLNTNGYYRVNLSLGGTYKKYYIHRLVAIAFLDNPKNLPSVNHKNGIRTDNSLLNLEWCTHAENMQHAYDTGLNKQQKGDTHYKSKPVDVFDQSGKKLFHFGSALSASNALNIPVSTIRFSAQRGYLIKYAGLVFKDSPNHG